MGPVVLLSGPPGGPIAVRTLRFSRKAGYEGLDQYGRWDNQPGYGQVWMPTTVAVGWAPYHDGHWAWIAPWGWTWVDDAPWGFAPYHYGRWAFFGNVGAGYRDRMAWLPFTHRRWWHEWAAAEAVPVSA